MSRVHRYPARAIRREAAAVGLGLAAAGAVLVAVPPPAVIWIIALAVFVLFAVQAARVWHKARFSVAVDDEGLSTSARRSGKLRWSELAAMRLAYYSTRRDRRGGWMQLTARGATGAIRVDSTLDGFEEIVRLTARAARHRNLDLDPATRANLAALGVAPADRPR